MQTFLPVNPGNPSKKMRLVLRHNPGNGVMSISIDGDIVWENKTTMQVTNIASALKKKKDIENRTFFFGQGSKGILFFTAVCKGIVPIPTHFRYAFYVCGSSPQDEATKIAKGEEGKHFKIWITKAEVSGKGVAWYRIDTKNLATGSGVAVHRRFRGFHFLHRQLGNYFKGSHLFQSLPRPPQKGVKLIQNHQDPNFIEERRLALEAYLRKLMVFPRVPTCQEMLDFLGFVGNHIRESSVMFHSGPLGLKMARQGMGMSRVGIAQFNQIKDKKTGEMLRGPAEESGLLNIGDSLTRVHGESVSQLEYEDAIRMVITSPRPVLLHFAGYEVKVAAESTDGEGDQKT